MSKNKVYEVERVVSKRYVNGQVCTSVKYKNINHNFSVIAIVCV